VAAHGDDQVGSGQKLGGDRLGRDAGQADAAFGKGSDDGGVEVVGRVGAG
jgi:hypothetical protein